jgi:hypothetical protein
VCGWGELASRAATTKGGRETGCRSRCCSNANHPIGFLVPSKQIFDSVAQHGTCQKRDGKRWKQRGLFKAWDESARGMLGRGKRLNCALRAFLRRVEPALEVGNPDLNSALQQCRNGKSSHFYGEFDSGSERTLAACLRHASRTVSFV